MAFTTNGIREIVCSWAADHHFRKQYGELFSWELYQGLKSIYSFGDRFVWCLQKRKKISNVRLWSSLLNLWSDYIIRAKNKRNFPGKCISSIVWILENLGRNRSYASAALTTQNILHSRKFEQKLQRCGTICFLSVVRNYLRHIHT